MIEQFQIGEKITGLVVFELDNKEFCADLKNISAILNPRDIEKIGNDLNQSSSIKLNEITIPLIDLHKILNLKYKKRSKDMRLILVEVEDKLFSFKTERVKEIFTVNPFFRDKINFVPVNDKYLLGKLCYEKREMLMPDFKSIIEETL